MPPKRNSRAIRGVSWWSLLQGKATKAVQANFTCFFLMMVVTVFQYITFSVLVVYSSGCVENDRRAWRDMYSVVQLQMAGLRGEISGDGGGDAFAGGSSANGGLGRVGRSFWRARRCPSHDAAWKGTASAAAGGAYVAPGIGRLATVSEVEAVQAIPELVEWHDDGRRKISLRRDEWDPIFLLRLLNSHGIHQDVDAMVWATRGDANGTFWAHKEDRTLSVAKYLAERNVRVCVTQPYLHGRNETGGAKKKKVHAAYKHPNVQAQQEDLQFLSADLFEQYDFTFSAHALDDAGSIALGARFVIDSLAALRPGGLAVFVAELDLAALPGTSGRVVNTPAGDVVVWTRADVERLSKDVARLGYEMGKVCWASEKEADRLLSPTNVPRVLPPPKSGSLALARKGEKLFLTTVGFWVKKPRTLDARPARLHVNATVGGGGGKGARRGRAHGSRLRCKFAKGQVGKKKKKGPLPIFITDEQRDEARDGPSFLHNPARKKHQLDGEHL
jgi:hypothetical protein